MTYIKSTLSLIGIILFGVFLFFRNAKPKEEFEKIHGRISYLSDHIELFPDKDRQKNRFIQVENNEIIFEIFIGKETGDFSPQFEKIDSLKVGSLIDIYYDTDAKGDDYNINYLTQFIDKEGKPYFIRGDKDKYGSYFFIAIGIIGILTLTYLKKKGTIN